VSDPANTDLTATRASSAPPVGALATVGPFALVSKLGEGGMGTVYRARDSHLNRDAAVKLMRPELAAHPTDRERFLREARAAAAVESEFVVPIWGFGEAQDGTPYLVMPLLKGETLGARLAREPVSSPDLITKVARDVARGLRAAHEQGLVHRDIKPNNVWLEGDPCAAALGEQVVRCLVFDFGLARAIGPQSDQITSAGSVVGTPAYMAPEQARGEPADARTDLFALGALLFRMATGRQPFEAPTAGGVPVAVATARAPEVRPLAPHLPPELAGLIDRLLQKAPADRPQSAAAVLAHLDTPAAPAPKRAHVRDRWLLFAVLALATAALVAGLSIRFGPSRAAGPKPQPDGPSGTRYVNPVGMSFALVPKGEGWFGGLGGVPGDEYLRIEDDYYIGTHEVTQEQWEAVTGDNPSRFRRTGAHADKVRDVPDADLKRFPVDSLSLVAARAFADKLNQRYPVPGWEYRVPTLARWEYACRGGPRSRGGAAFDFYFAEPTNAVGTRANLRGTGPGRPQPVGAHPPNALGLYDMHGNVSEVCALDDARAFYKGGAFDDESDLARAGFASTGEPNDVHADVGLRVVLVPRAK
jgi:formylglycine-generating enzyme required for sulfatase activity/tRNA A-37 threonylcarbamoyl transferase component Bud32